MAKLDPNEVRLNRGPSREDLLENYDNLLTLMEDQDQLRLKMSALTRQMEELNSSARIRDLNMPKEVEQAPVSSAAKASLSDAKAFIPVFAGIVGGCYIVSKLLLSVPQDFLIIIGLFTTFLGMILGLVAYWPLWIPCKILDLLTPFTVKPMMELLYGPVKDYLVFFIAGFLTLVALIFLFRAVTGVGKKRKYKADMAYYNKNKDSHHEQEKLRVRQVMAQIEALTPEYETVRGEFLAYESAIRGLFLFLRIDDPRWQHKDAVLTMHEYISSFRADKPREATLLYADECRHKAELRSIQAAYDKMDAHNRSLELMRRLDEACLRMDAESARAAMERSAKKAHNAQVYADYKYHEMAGDISDMDTYAWLKLQDLEL